MNNTAEKAVAIGGLVLLLVLGVDLILLPKAGLQVVTYVLPYLTVALLLSVLGFVRIWLMQRVLEEKLEHAESVAEDKLFQDDTGTQAFSMARGREQFERVMVPFVAPLLAALEGFWAWALFRHMDIAESAASGRLMGASFMFGQAFILFLFCRYFIGMGGVKSFRLLHGVGTQWGLAAIASALAGVAAMLGELNMAWADSVTMYILLLGLVLLAGEKLLLWFAAFYAPRRRIMLRRAYETRLGKMLTDPTSWVGSVAQTVDYQFGYTYSGHWFTRFFKTTLLPLCAATITLLYLMSCFIFIGPSETGLRERFGKPTSHWKLESGFHLKWPWPFEQVRRVPGEKIVTLNVGFKHEEDAGHPEIILWTIPHYEEEDLILVPSDAAGKGQITAVGLLSFSVPVEYLITNVYHYTYQFSEPKRIITHIVQRTLVCEMAAREMQSILSADKHRIASALKKRIQAEADALQLGVEFLLVGLHGVHPPVAVAASYQAVIGAQKEREATIINAKAYAQNLTPMTTAEGLRLHYEAEASQQMREVLAAAEIEEYNKRLQAYRTAPKIYKKIMHLNALRRGLSGTRKYIMDTAGMRQIVNLDFSKTIDPDLLDFDFGSPEKKHEKK